MSLCSEQKPETPTKVRTKSLQSGKTNPALLPPAGFTQCQATLDCEHNQTSFNAFWFTAAYDPQLLHFVIDIELRVGRLV
jgi:hypothetical protein